VRGKKNVLGWERSGAHHPPEFQLLQTIAEDSLVALNLRHEPCSLFFDNFRTSPKFESGG